MSSRTFIGFFQIIMIVAISLSVGNCVNAGEASRQQLEERGVVVEGKAQLVRPLSGVGRFDLYTVTWVDDFGRSCVAMGYSAVTSMVAMDCDYPPAASLSPVTRSSLPSDSLSGKEGESRDAR